jgi:hypothetical protein
MTSSENSTHLNPKTPKTDFALRRSPIRGALKFIGKLSPSTTPIPVQIPVSALRFQGNLALDDSEDLFIINFDCLRSP